MSADTAIAIFHNDGFSRAWPDSAVDEESPWGRDCAEFLMEELKKVGLVPRTREPVQGEGGWSFTVQLPRSSIRIFLMWAPLGAVPQDFWTLQLVRGSSIVAKLFQKEQWRAELEQVRRAVEKSLTSHPSTKDFRWVTPEAFKRLY